MSVSYSGKIVVGVRLPAASLASLYETRKTKAFDHDCPPEWKVHPRTGKALWREEQILRVRELTDDTYDFEREKSDAIACVYFGNAMENRSRNAVIGRLTIHIRFDDDGVEPTPVVAPPYLIDEERALLRTILEPHGLWKDAQFGLWFIPSIG